MTAFTAKTFSVHGPKQADPRRDCATLGHWPREIKTGVFVCYWCKQPCQVDGTDREPTP